MKNKKGYVSFVLHAHLPFIHHPESNDYLFYVTDKNRKIYYSKTGDEHEKKVADIKKKGDWIW